MRFVLGSHHDRIELRVFVNLLIAVLSGLVLFWQTLSFEQHWKGTSIGLYLWLLFSESMFFCCGLISNGLLFGLWPSVLCKYGAITLQILYITGKVSLYLYYVRRAYFVRIGTGFIMYGGGSGGRSSDSTTLNNRLDRTLLSMYHCCSKPWIGLHIPSIFIVIGYAYYVFVFSTEGADHTLGQRSNSAVLITHHTCRIRITNDISGLQSGAVVELFVSVVFTALFAIPLFRFLRRTRHHQSMVERQRQNRMHHSSLMSRAEEIGSMNHDHNGDERGQKKEQPTHSLTTHHHSTQTVFKSAATTTTNGSSVSDSGHSNVESKVLKYHGPSSFFSSPASNLSFIPSKKHSHSSIGGSLTSASLLSPLQCSHHGIIGSNIAGVNTASAFGESSDLTDPMYSTPRSFGKEINSLIDDEYEQIKDATMPAIADGSGNVPHLKIDDERSPLVASSLAQPPPPTSSSLLSYHTPYHHPSSLPDFDATMNTTNDCSLPSGNTISSQSSSTHSSNPGILTYSPRLWSPSIVNHRLLNGMNNHNNRPSVLSNQSLQCETDERVRKDIANALFFNLCLSTMASVSSICTMILWPLSRSDRLWYFPVFEYWFQPICLFLMLGRNRKWLKRHSSKPESLIYCCGCPLLCPLFLCRQLWRMCAQWMCYLSVIRRKPGIHDDISQEPSSSKMSQTRMASKKRGTEIQVSLTVSNTMVPSDDTLGSEKGIYSRLVHDQTG